MGTLGDEYHHKRRPRSGIMRGKWSVDSSEQEKNYPSKVTGSDKSIKISKGLHWITGEPK